MRPMLHPTLVNGRTGDPALYIETLFEKRAILFDLGDITASRGTEMYIALWLRLMGAAGTGRFNIHVVR